MATIAKKSKSRRQPESASAALDELQGFGDRLAEWAADNAALLVGAALAILVLVGAIGLLRSNAESTALERAQTLARIEDDFRAAMGADPSAIDVPEPANPATARAAREEALSEFRALAEDAQGTVPGSIAGLRAGELQAELGDAEAALGTWRAALQGLDTDSPLRGFLLAKIAGQLEDAGRPGEAAAAWAEVAALPGYPLRAPALANAARTYAQAGETEAALQAFEQLQTGAPDYRIPPHVQARLAELRAREAR